MVQEMGNTLRGSEALKNVADALEREPEDGPENGVCDEGISATEFSGVVPGVWGQCEDGVQVAGALYGRRVDGIGGSEPQAARAPRGVGGGGGVRDGALEGGAPALGAAEDPGAL